MRAQLSPLARIVLRVLDVARATPAELAAETKIPVALIERALTELRNAGCAVELEPGRWNVTALPSLGQSERASSSRRGAGIA